MKTKLIYIIAVFLLAISCSSEEKPFIKGGDYPTSIFLSKGMQTDASATTVDLSFHHITGILTVTCDEYWCKVENISSDPSMTSTDVKLLIDKNSDLTSRKATLTLTVDGFTRTIDILQEAEDILQPEDDIIYAAREEKDFGVRLETNVSGEIKVDFRFDGQPDWIEFVDTVYANSNPWIPGDILHFTTPQCYLHFKTKENTGLGRICEATLSVGGSDVKSRLCIIQQPRLFDEEETIAINNAGTLDVLIGTDKENIRRVRNLKLTGEMNGLDWTALRSFFYQGMAMDPEPDAYPVKLDLSQIYSVKGNRSHYSAWNYPVKEPELYVYQDYDIPQDALAYYVNLAGIILPEKTVRINSGAFRRSISLTSIDIPDNVEEISNGVFNMCLNLKEINISDNSRLKKLGREAFSGCGPIEYVNLPISLTDIVDGYLDFSVMELKVHWPTPPALRVPPVVREGSVLYVPKGSAPLYQDASGWNRFPTIEEYDE